MSVLKLSKNDIIRNGDSEDKIKLKRSNLSFDTAMVSGWEQTNRESLDILNDYNNRINKSEWLDEEDRKKYRSALDSYIETSNYLRGINKTFGEGYSDEDEQKWTDSIASMNAAYDSTDKYYSQWIDEKDYKGQRDGWFQKSNLFDDGYQFGDITKTIGATITDAAQHVGAGIVGIGEAALDGLMTIAPYIAQGQYYANGGGYNLQASQAFDQSIETSKKGVSEFVAKDLYDEEAVAKAIIAEPVKAVTGIDAETDSVFGAKSDSLGQSAGQLVGTAGLQAVGVPWWLTTGVTSLGSESQNALNQGATLDEAAFSGLVSAGAEILTEKISGGISFGGKTLDDFLPSLTSKISSKVVRKLADLGIDMVGEGGEEVLSGVMSAIGQKMTYASDKELSELFSSEDAFDSFIGGAVLGLGGGVVGNVKKTIDSNKQAKNIYGDNIQDLLIESAEIGGDNTALVDKLTAKYGKKGTLSGYDINRLVEANENAMVSQDKGKMKAATEARLAELGEGGDISTLADVIVKAQSGEKLTSSEQKALVNSKYGRRVSTELNPVSIESGEYASKWAEDIGTERINTEAYNRGVTEASEAVTEPTETNVVTENASVKESAVEGEYEASVGDAKNATNTVAKATMVDTEGNEVEAKVAKIADVESGEASLELEDGKTVKASEVDFGDSGIGLVYKAATEMVSGVGGFNVDAANLMVKGFNPSGSIQAAGAYVSGFNEAYRYGAMGYPVSELSRGVETSKLSEKQREAAYNLGKAYGNEKVALKQAKIDSTVSIKAGKDSIMATKKGKVYFDGSAVGKTLTERQKASLKGLRVIAEGMGVNIHIFESKVGKDGKRQGANGWYDPVKKEIHLDLHAGVDGNGVMLFTVAHELTHHIREVAPAKFKIFADALLEEYTKNGVSLDDLIAKKIEQLERNKQITPNMTEEQIHDLAYEEVVADSCEAMLVDSGAIEALSRKIQSKDKGLWEKIRDFIAKLVARIKAAYEGLDPDSAEGKTVRDMVISAERLQKLWVDALLEASEAKFSDRARNPYDGKVLYADSEVYDYSFLVSLDPMVVKTMPSLSTVKVDGKISQSKTVELGLKNAASIGKKVADDQYAIKNTYTKRDIIIGKGGLQHSLDASSISRLRTNARLSSIGGYIVQNAVPINGLNKENKQANGTYAMACLLNDGNGFVVAIVTVDEFSSRATKFDFVEITHSINGRFLAKKEDSRSSTRELELGQESLSTTAISEISIADFLEIVNSSHQSILSNDVLEHFGETRNPDGHYAKRVLFQDRDPDSYSNRSLLAGALETAAQNDIERQKLQQYKQKIDLINSEEQKLHDLRAQIKELSFAKGKRDTEAIKKLQFEANQAANRINTYDKQLLNLESTKALKGVLEREKALARKRDAQKYKEAE